MKRLHIRNGAVAHGGDAQAPGRGPSPLILILMLSAAAPVGVGCRSSHESAEAADSFSTKSSSGEISFDLTPRMDENSRLIVEVRANTHSGDLADLDLASLISLEASGKTYHPTAATNLRGHHASGSVTFALDGKPERFSVTLGAVRNLSAQHFEWP